MAAFSPFKLGPFQATERLSIPNRYYQNGVLPGFTPNQDGKTQNAAVQVFENYLA